MISVAALEQAASRSAVGLLCWWTADEFSEDGRVPSDIGEYLALLPPATLLALVEATRALAGTGWHDSDGLCWCPEAIDMPGRPPVPHLDRCLRARAALGRFSFTDGSEA